jgi:hypothetical protein
VSLESFAGVTLRVASQRVFNYVGVLFRYRVSLENFGYSHLLETEEFRSLHRSAAGWMTEVRCSGERERFFLSHRGQAGSGTRQSFNPSIQWIFGGLFSGVKSLGREANLSPPSSAEVKNVWSYNSTTHTFS